MQCVGTKDDVSCTKLEWVYAFGNITNASDGEENFRNLKDDSNNERTVFIRYNKNNLSERYVCTTYNMTNNEPTCISKNAYNTKDDTNSEWNHVKTLFGETNCIESSYVGVYVRCRVEDITIWSCQSGNNNSYCIYSENGFVTRCEVNNSFTSCSVVEKSGTIK
ncbi:MAG: hypothetical protein IJK66_03785 [Bacilli bacterium]|nr:hypothetical protein [Bacilli bacterium]